MRKMASLLVMLALLGIPECIFAQNEIVKLGDETAEREPTASLMPFAFYSELLEAAGGLSLSARGYGQDQLFGQVTVIGSSNSSLYTVINLRDFRIPVSNRLFLSGRFFGGKFGLIKSFAGQNPDFPGQRAGGNDSDVENYLELEGNEVDLDADLRFLFPIGHGRGEPIARVVLDQGLLHDGATGATGWHPFSSGRTFLEINPFYRKRKGDLPTGQETETETMGVKLGLTYENTDFSENPTRGSTYRLAYAKDWGEKDGTVPWETVEAEYSKYFDLGSGTNSRQRVLAFNFWTIRTPTWWDFDLDAAGQPVFRRPPSYKGATMGGWQRFRAFDQNRFNDSAAIMYTLEYRHTLKWNPIGERKMLMSETDVDWFQLVGFTEVGRVAPEWDLSTLHEDLKWDAGAGLRVWANDLLLRVDVAYSSEGPGVQMMIEHPFQ